MSHPLEKEYQTYLTHRRDLIAKHLDKYVLIKDDQIVDCFDCYETALRRALKSFGNVPVFIKNIKHQEEVRYYHRGQMI